MKIIAMWLALAVQEPVPPPPIADNSFLIEEAYNQEPGVVQHISTLLRANKSWAYSFTQEWPLWSQRHQGSFTVPVFGGGVGDIALNYRLQLGGERTAFAPRLSAILPTGSVAEGRGTGELGIQANLPVSVALAPMLVTHWNAGVTVTPGVDETVYNAGASVIWLALPTVNLMLEALWVGETSSGELIINPGVRWAHNLGSLQVVPGVAFPDGRDLFFYLSFEHPFKSN
jgi:hypothetical protein